MGIKEVKRREEREGRVFVKIRSKILGRGIGCILMEEIRFFLLLCCIIVVCRIFK